MNISTRQFENASIVDVTGDITLNKGGDVGLRDKVRSLLQQGRTRLLFDKTLQMLLLTLRFANVPLLMPLHRLAADLLDAVYGGATLMETDTN